VLDVQIYLAGLRCQKSSDRPGLKLPRFPDQSSDPACRRNTQPTGLASDVSGDRDRAVCHLGSSSFSAAAVKTQDSPTTAVVIGPGMFFGSQPVISRQSCPSTAGKQIFMGICPTKSCQQHSIKSMMACACCLLAREVMIASKFPE